MQYFDLGSYTRPVTVANADAQLWFDRGLVWTYGYNHEEAIACFERALEADPACAMAQWGIAYAAGPNYNMPWELFDPDGLAAALARAHDATAEALRLAGAASPLERALIEALPARYPSREPVADPAPWNDAFADAMRAAHAAHPHDLEIATIFVEALMNRTPWKMWDLATGDAAAGADTEEARAVLEAAFDRDPAAWDHPGLLHLYVHLMEMSPFPERALRQGDRLRTLVPDAGHLVHMPTHIDVLCGHYRDDVHWNERAIEADDRFVAERGAMNFYTLYRIHDHHFAIYGALFLGQFTPALRAAEALVASVPETLLAVTSPPMADFLEPYLSMKPHVLIRFGRWEEILAEPFPEDRALHCTTTATLHYARAVAYSALGRVAEAEAERARFLEARARVPETRLLHNNTVRDLLAVAGAMLDGELEYRKGNHSAAYAHLREAVRLDDGLPYDEPWGWMQPTRHALGALLMEQGHLEEAEAVYRADLGLDGSLARACQHPDNLWSLHGLHECLTRRGETALAPLIRQRLDLALARAEVPVHASCYCRRLAAA